MIAVTDAGGLQAFVLAAQLGVGDVGELRHHRVALREPVPEIDRFAEQDAAPELLAVQLAGRVLAVVNGAAEAEPGKPAAPKIPLPPEADVGLAGIARGIPGQAKMGAWRPNDVEDIGGDEDDFQVYVDAVFLVAAERPLIVGEDAAADLRDHVPQGPRLAALGRHGRCDAGCRSGCRSGCLWRRGRRR